MSYGEGAIGVRYFSDDLLNAARPECAPYRGVKDQWQRIHHGRAWTPATPQHERNNQMATKLCGFQSRKIAAFLAGLVTGVLIGGCSVFGPGIGASVY